MTAALLLCLCAVVAMQGMWAAHKKKSILLAVHVIFGYMLGICLGAFAVSVYYDMETRCVAIFASPALPPGFLAKAPQSPTAELMRPTYLPSYLLPPRCEVLQAAYVGCAGCRCSWTNECTVVSAPIRFAPPLPSPHSLPPPSLWSPHPFVVLHRQEDFREIEACKNCVAWPTEVCRNVIVGLGSGMTLTSVMVRAAVRPLC
jgi:hypothetical protein